MDPIAADELPGRIAARDLLALADQLLVDAIEVEHALRLALLVARDGSGIVRAFVTPRAKAAALLHEAARQLGNVPDLDGAGADAWAPPMPVPAPRRRVGRPRKPAPIFADAAPAP